MSSCSATTDPGNIPISRFVIPSLLWPQPLVVLWPTGVIPSSWPTGVIRGGYCPVLECLFLWCMQVQKLLGVGMVFFFPPMNGCLWRQLVRWMGAYGGSWSSLCARHSLDGHPPSSSSPTTVLILNCGDGCGSPWRKWLQYLFGRCTTVVSSPGILKISSYVICDVIVCTYTTLLLWAT